MNTMQLFIPQIFLQLLINGAGVAALNKTDPNPAGMEFKNLARKKHSKPINAYITV